MSRNLIDWQSCIRLLFHVPSFRFPLRRIPSILGDCSSVRPLRIHTIYRDVPHSLGHAKPLVNKGHPAGVARSVPEPRWFLIILFPGIHGALQSRLPPRRLIGGCSTCTSEAASIKACAIQTNPGPAPPPPR